MKKRNGEMERGLTNREIVVGQKRADQLPKDAEVQADFFAGRAKWASLTWREKIEWGYDFARLVGTGEIKGLTKVPDRSPRRYYKP